MKKLKRRIKTFFKRIFTVMGKPEMALLPGQLAFSIILAVIPTITLLSYGASILNLSTDFLYDIFAKSFSSNVADLLLSTSNASNAGLKLSIVLIVSYYMVSNGTASVILSSNTIYGIEDTNWFKRRFKAIIMAFILVIVITFLLLIPAFGDTITSFLANANLKPEVVNIVKQVFTYMQSPIMWVLLFLLIKLIYVLAPDRQIMSHNANYGAIFTTVLWISVTSIYSFYISNIANYSAIYGSLASVCVLMIWFYLLAYIFVIGMSLNYQKESEELEKTGNIKKKNE